MDDDPTAKGALHARLTRELLDGLRAQQKSIPSQLLYDSRGSALFEEICKLDEYYLTRSELAIMRAYGPEMAAALGPQCLLVEYGSGASTKTQLLLDALQDPVGYVPVDISSAALDGSVGRLRRRHPELDVLPVCADYTGDYAIPTPARPPRRRAVYFPGSTIGNLSQGDARDFLAHIGEICGSGGGLLVGVDLHKDTKTLEAAYDDSRGVTARFELNVLERLNREFGADFEQKHFEYRSFYSVREQRIEMYLVSLESQRVRVAGDEIELAEGEAIRTEYSHKFTLESFAELAGRAGLNVEKVWTDPEELFSVQFLRVA